MKNKGDPKRSRVEKETPKKEEPPKPKDYSTAILDRKKAPYRLLAEEGVGPSEDASVIQYLLCLIL